MAPGLHHQAIELAELPDDGRRYELLDGAAGEPVTGPEPSTHRDEPAPPAGRDAVPSVTVFDLGADGYREVTRAEGDEQSTVALPMPGAEPVTLSPRQLVEF